MLKQREGVCVLRQIECVFVKTDKEQMCVCKQETEIVCVETHTQKKRVCVLRQGVCRDRECGY